MKIAISTQDGLNMSSSLESAKGFLIITEMFNEIVAEEIRIKPESGSTDHESLYSLLSDCSQLVIMEIEESAKQYFTDKGLQIFRTNESIITNVIVHFLAEYYREASNTCCCP